MADANLGTVYLQVMPSMQGFVSNINRTLSGMNMKSSGKAMGQNLGNSVGKGLSVAKIAIGTAIGNAINGAMNAIRGSIDNAIGRVDTLNQFPKVMQQMGYSADEAAKLIKGQLTDAVEGLPTRLQDMVTLTQQMTLALGDMGKGADAAQAVNDGLLAYGASADQASMATDALTKMISSGSYDLERWRTVLENCPPLLGNVAKEMLGADASAEDLRMALKDGKVSTEDFVEALIKLDKEGGDGIEAFQSAVKSASSGISTSMTNARNAVANGLANIIDAFNGPDKVIETFFDGVKATVKGLFAELKPVAEQLGQMVAPAVTEFTTSMKNGAPFVDALRNAVGKLPGPIGTVAAAFMDSAGYIVDSVKGAFDQVVESFGGWAKVSGFLSDALEALAGPIKVVGKAIGDIAGAAIRAGASIGKSLFGAFKRLFDSLGGSDAILGAVSQAFEALADGIEWVGGVVSGVIGVFSDLIQGAMPGLQKAAEAVWPFLEQLVDIFGQIVEGAIVLGDYLANSLGPVFDALGDLAEAVFPFIQDVVGTAWQFIQDITADVWPGIQTLIDGAATAIKGAIDGVRPIVDGLGSAFDRLKPFIQGVADVLGPIIEGAAKICGDALTWIGEELLPDLGQAISVIMEGSFGDFVDFLSNEVAPILSDIGELLGPIIDAVEFIAGCTFEGPVNAVDPLLEKLEELGITVDETALKTETSTGRMSRAYSSDLNSAAGSLSSFGSAADECLRITQDSLRNTGKAAGDTEADLDRFASNASGSLDGLATDTSISFDELATQTSSSMGSVKQTVQDGFESVRSIASGKVEEIKSSVSGAWDSMSDSATLSFAEIKAGITHSLDEAATAVSEKVESIKATITGGWNTLTVGTTTAFTELKDTVSAQLSMVGVTASEQVSAMRETISGAFTAITETGSTAFNGLSGAVSAAMGSAQAIVFSATSQMTSAVTNMQLSLSASFAAIRTTATGAFSGLSGSVQTSIQRIRSTVTSGMAETKAAFQNAMNAMKSNFSQGFTSIQTTATQKMAAIRESVRSTFVAITSQITSSMGAARSAMQSGCAAMVAAWNNMHFSPKHIPLPHFSISGSLSATSVPVYSVSWYKQGGLFQSPHLIGVGEDGPEAVLPLTRATDLIADGVASRTASKQDIYDAMVAALEKVGPPELALYMDRRKFASSMAEANDYALGRLQAMRS